ncbi:zinc finger protein 701 [Drosophila innubila]|uniref:zinc finger protein 701 n=1 Tax=Drosophila innubila TaxID=198719 RepID=UPI00148BD104|nr:zinc finger protein 701 [Drosophila innubila]
MNDVNNNFIEAAKLYLKVGERTSIVIKCSLCRTGDLTDWSQLAKHLASFHSVLGTRLVNQDLEVDKEIQEEVEEELQNQSYAKIGRESETADTEIEVVDEEYLFTAADEVEVEKEIDQTCGNKNKSNQPFYSLPHTDPKLMNYFIDLLRQHEYLWSEEYRNMDFKAERSESARKISQALAERFNLSLDPQIVCLSVRAILKWFEKQYAMHISNRNYRTRHQSYYDKLLEFVPTQDITVVDCDECERRFYNEDQLRRHKHRIHFGSHPYACDVCNKVFLHASKLRMHQDRFHKMFTRWKCTICSYCAPNKWDLRTHLTSHTGERNYTCELCGISTKSSSALAVHRRTHSDPKKKCPFCPKEYRENYHLKCHIIKSHTKEVKK